MTPTWEFTGAEFEALWAGLEAEFMPEPFIHSSEPCSADEAEFALRQDWLTIKQRWGHELDDMTRVLTSPDIRVIVRGYGGGERLTDPTLSVRMLAVRKGDVGYLVRQRPGRTLYHADGFVVTRHDALSLGDVVAGQLPAAEPGRSREITLDEPTDDQFDRSYGRSLVQHYDDDAAVQTQTFQQARLDRDGFIDVEQGWSRFGPRGIVRLRLGWRDLTDDGRYVIVPGTPPVAVGADRKRVVSLINSQIAEVVRAIRDDRA
ncbi:ESX secretion-associated protein EspG [Nocardia asteroides]|uniref:ESX secretion-associated protein EspG n=1 Tax=Nocardia asteroides TaxID=1824 RepID=UPI001E606769|nr:ESX secretion-associated protein EspG [Nocardia asteroides]UGT53478.1 ESX secretion-associated protein EspG [Nocardia asteroides]